MSATMSLTHFEIDFPTTSGGVAELFISVFIHVHSAACSNRMLTELIESSLSPIDRESSIDWRLRVSLKSEDNFILHTHVAVTRMALRKKFLLLLSLLNWQLRFSKSYIHRDTCCQSHRSLTRVHICLRSKIRRRKPGDQRSEILNIFELLFNIVLLQWKIDKTSYESLSKAL